MKKDPFSREEVYRIPSVPPRNRQLQSPTPTLKTLLNGSIRFRAPSVAPTKLGSLRSQVWPLHMGGGKLESHLLLAELQGRPSRSGRSCGASEKGELTAHKGEGERAGWSYIDSLIDRGKEMWPGW